MMQWSDYGYDAKMKLIGDALNRRYWSTSDCGCEDVIDLITILIKRGVHGAYSQYLAELLGFRVDTITPEQIAIMMTSDLDVQYHAAARALGALP